jgi:hypothetical protein
VAGAAAAETVVAGGAAVEVMAAAETVAAGVAAARVAAEVVVRAAGLGRTHRRPAAHTMTDQMKCFM